MAKNPNHEEPELSLKELETRYYDLFNRISDLIMIHDLEGRLLNVNPAVSNLSDYTFEELIGRPISDFIVPKFRHLFQNQYLKEIKKQGHSEGVVLFQAKDGKVHFVEYSNVLVKQDGREPYISGLGRDITERVSAERALRESEKLHRTVFETTGTATVIVEADEIISLANSTFEDLSGYSKKEIEGKKKWTEFVIKEDLKQTRKYYRVRRDRPGSAPKNCEFRFIDRQGNIKNIFVTIEMIPGTQKSVASLLNITHRKKAEEALQKAYQGLEYRVNERTADLVKANMQLKRETKERKQVEKELRKSQERYALATQAAKVGVWDWNVQTNEFYLDRNIKKILGYNDSEIPNDLAVWSGYVHPEDEQLVMDAFQAHIDGKTPEFVYEHRMNHKDGTVRWIMARGTAIRDAQGNPIRVVGTDTDITLRKKAEEERKKLEKQIQHAQKLEAIGTLAGGVAHSFNNLLMAILGRVSLIRYNMDADNPHYELLNSIEKSVRSGAELTSRLLGYARKGKYQIIPLDLNQLVKETADTISRTKKEITIHCELSEGLFSINADHGQMEQVMLNLFVNAADAMPEGGKLIVKTLNVTQKDMKDKLYNPNPGNYVQLAVTDSGIGMDKETMERVFDPFFTTKRFGRGTGLGLASVYGIIKGHSGYINVDSEKGRGTTFTINLPASGQKARKPSLHANRIIKGNGTILLVDDEEMILDGGRRMLVELGYNVFEARSGKEAVEIYKENKDEVDMVILDMIMPVMGGGETYDRIKEINSNVKVLLCSGYSLDGQATDILKRGCDDFIQKPFSLDELSGKIMKVMVQE